MKLCCAVGVLACSLLTFCPEGLADALPPEAIDCFGKQIGDACIDRSTQQSGSCREGTCTSQKIDAGPITYQCNRCDTSVPPDGDGACTLGSQGAVRKVGPWLLAGLFSLLFLIGRRRHRR